MAVLFTNNLAEVGRGVVQSQCFTVQDYHYHCFRERDDQGNPYGGILSEYLDFSVIVSSLRRTAAHPRQDAAEQHGLHRQ